ncbi:LacI family DNA-binding transcriptional regulator [Bacillus sp. UMB0893]|uniref:LacI family DNA-binding transcriptional regulator n=1 Tax=Bacillus sp. UMB0893 TaxID=2066053 RepID=UPI0021522BC0|nr:LacI family DNA-binding transcriptional regulator [Bacillus sp. UMB0893]
MHVQNLQNRFNINSVRRGSTLATIDDVAKAAGVSKSTVSSVFSKKRPISKEVSEHVLRIAKELNYKPNYWARTLATKETRIIGLNMQAENVKFSQFHLSLINGVLQECYSKGFQLLINTLSSEFKNEIQNQVSSPVDGEVLMDPANDDSRLNRDVIKERPFVIIGKPPELYENIVSYVDNDNIGTATDVTAYLLELGHKEILFLNAPKHRTVSEDREAGYKRAFIANNIPHSAELIVHKKASMTSVEFGHTETVKMLKQNPNITAIIADNDKMALGVYRAAEDLQLSIPNDLSVIAFSDDSIFAPEFDPPLSSVKLNSELLGREAAKLLIEQIQAKDWLIKRIVIPAELIHRGSTEKLMTHST